MKLKIAKLAAALFIIGILPLLTSSTAFAVSLGVTPGEMTFNISTGDTGVGTLYIINQDNTTSDFHVYVEGENEDWFTITPDRFTLGSQEIKSVNVMISPPLTAPSGEHDIEICIISIPPDSNLHIGAGVKVQTHVNIIEVKANTGTTITDNNVWIIYIVIAVSAAIALDIGITLRKRRKVKHV